MGHGLQSVRPWRHLSAIHCRDGRPHIGSSLQRRPTMPNLPCPHGLSHNHYRCISTRHTENTWSQPGIAQAAIGLGHPGAGRSRAWSGHHHQQGPLPLCTTRIFPNGVKDVASRLRPRRWVMTTSFPHTARAQPDPWNWLIDHVPCTIARRAGGNSILRSNSSLLLLA